MVLTFVSESAEKINADHLHCGLEHPLLDDMVDGVCLVQHVNDLNQALLLLLLQVLVLLRVGKVGNLVARLQLGQVKDLPLGAVDVYQFNEQMGLGRLGAVRGSRAYL